MSKRSLGAVVLAVITGPLTTACSPPTQPMTAVYLGNGFPAAVFHPCDGSTVDGVHVAEESLDGTEWTRGWETFRRHQQTPGADIDEVQLLEAPRGWMVPDSVDLTEFREDRVYVVWADTSGSDANDEYLSFTLGDLEALGEGEVWAGGSDARAMTRDEFFDLHDCGGGWS